MDVFRNPFSLMILQSSRYAVNIICISSTWAASPTKSSRILRNASRRFGRKVGDAVRLCGSGEPDPGETFAAKDPGDRERSPGRARRQLRRASFRDRSPFDPARAPPADYTAADLLLVAIGAAPGAAARFRPVVPMVRRAGHRRSGLGRPELLEEPRSPARW